MSEQRHPAIDPESLFRMLFVGYLCEVRSERSEGGYAVIDLADSRMILEPVEWICVWFELTRRDPAAFFTFLEASGRNWDARARMDMMSAALLHGFGANILNSWSERTGLSIENIFPEV